MKQATSKLILFYTLAVTVILSVVRFFQYMTLIDFDTGFFYTGSEVGGAVIYILLVLFAAGYIAVAITAEKKGNSAFSVSSDGMGSKATIFLGLSLIAGGLLLGAQIFEENSRIMLTVMIAVRCAALFAAGFILLRNTVPPAFVGILCMAAAVGMFFGCCFKFADDMRIVNHSDELILLIAYIAGAVFLTDLARFYSRLEPAKRRGREIVTAGLTFIVSGTHVLSKLIAYAFGGYTTEGMSGIDLNALGLMLISGVFIAVVTLTEKNKDIVLLENEEEADAREKLEKQQKKSADDPA